MRDHVRLRGAEGYRERFFVELPVSPAKHTYVRWQQ